MSSIKSAVISLSRLLFLFGLCSDSLALKMVRFEVPERAIRGQPQTLSCLFQLLPSERLVNLKWYFNGKEFLRYEPASNRETQLFNLPNLRLNLQDVSNDEFHGSRVRLLHVDHTQEGRYTCEVTCNRNFFTITEVKYMQVVTPPEATTQLFLPAPPDPDLELAYPPTVEPSLQSVFEFTSSSSPSSAKRFRTTATTWFGDIFLLLFFPFIVWLRWTR